MVLIRICLVLALFFPVQALAQKVLRSDPYSRHMTHVFGQGFEGVVFSSAFPFPFTDSIHSERRFTPSLVEIEQAEAIFAAGIKALNKDRLNQGGTKGPVIDENMPRYIRQYFGYLNFQNERIVYISCLLNTNIDADKPRWRQGAVVVVNGGSNYFQVQANLSNASLFDLAVNSLDQALPDGRQ